MEGSIVYESLKPKLISLRVNIKKKHIISLFVLNSLKPRYMT